LCGEQGIRIRAGRVQFEHRCIATQGRIGDREDLLEGGARTGCDAVRIIRGQLNPTAPITGGRLNI